jgi:hypothetical protein
MDSVASYIIRIYRCEKDRPKSLVGVVLEAGKKGKKAFQSCDELWEILSSPGESANADSPKKGHLEMTL